MLSYIDIISKWSGKIFCWLVIALTAVVGGDVIARYAFNQPSIWAYDTALYIYSYLFLLGGAYVQWQRAQIRVDILFNRFPPRARVAIEIFFFLAIYFPVCVVFMWYGAKAAAHSLAIREISNLSPWGELVGPLRAAIPLAFFLLFLQGVAEFIRHLVFLVRGKQL